MKSSRRSFLKGLGAIFALPLAGLKPKSVDEELPGVVGGLPESSEEEKQPLTEEEQKFSDNPYRMADGGGSMRTVYFTPYHDKIALYNGTSWEFPGLDSNISTGYENEED